MSKKIKDPLSRYCPICRDKLDFNIFPPDLGNWWDCSNCKMTIKFVVDKECWKDWNKDG